MRGSRGGTGGPDPPPPLKNHKKLGCFANTGQDSDKSLKITKLPSQNSMLDQHRHASEKPFKWRFAGMPMTARLYWRLDPPSHHKFKNNVVKIAPL